MGLLDIFRIKEIKEYNTELLNETDFLKQEVNRLQSMLPKESKDILLLRGEIQQLSFQKQQIIQEINNLQSTKSNLYKESDLLRKTISSQKRVLTDINESIQIEEFGIYTPRYPCMVSEEIKIRISQIREYQKRAIKNGTAITGRKDWTVNNDGDPNHGNTGQKMINDVQKLILRAFNSEADEVIGKVKYNNVEKSAERIEKSARLISQLGKIFGISITPPYIQSKLDELHLAYEYQFRKQEEKEEQQELQRRMKEEEQLKREIERERNRINKEYLHYSKQKERIKQKLNLALSENEKQLYLSELQEVEGNISEIEDAIEDLNIREANQRVGYVYIISNIGSFGDNVYKIGMTRRLEPQERVNELGSASVPFKFDVHAMIFTEDAPTLENALHRHFSDRRVNMVNTRKEFFRVSLEEIEEFVHNNFDATVEFTKIADAPEYRLTEQMKRNNS